VDDALAAARLTWDDVEVEWAADLTASDGSPAEKFRSDPSIAACCVISPDMIGLTGGLEQKGTGAEGTVKGAHVVVSTAQMNRSIVDVYQCRKDYFDANKAEVEKFVVGYLKATEELMVAKKAYSDGQGQSPVYVNALKLAQQIYGPEVLPTIEIDAHGLVLDANFVRIPGNEAFFNDPNNLVGFQAKQDSALALAVKLGYSTQKMGFEPANWDYKKISELVGVKYVAPVYASGRIKAEVTDFGDDLEDDTIFTFEIKFEPEQIDFPVATYAADFQRFAKASATFGNAAIIIEGHADPTLAIQQFFWAAKAKGLITGTNGSYRFKGQPLDLTNTDAIVQAIQMENLAGQQRRNRSGQIEEIPDPKRTVAAALTLSKSRAEAVKAAIEDYAQQNNLSIDLSQALAHGVGVADPVNPKPSSMAEAKENMRVVFRVVRVAAEALSEDDFNFDE
jgi:outer membrane protein OmpA-like peptidoglycan-associated protein